MAGLSGGPKYIAAGSESRAVLGPSNAARFCHGLLGYAHEAGIHRRLRTGSMWVITMTIFKPVASLLFAAVALLIVAPAPVHAQVLDRLRTSTR